jgi:Ca-activated chloride channel family protein
MSNLHFAEPQWLQALWLLPALLAIVYWLTWRGDSALARFLSPRMQQPLVDRLSVARRRLQWVCWSFSIAGLTIALARPQYGLTFQETPRVGAQIIFCLDVSKSMLAEDTVPNRLDRAKAEIADLLTYLRGDQVGLIAFAGRAAVLCPLTPDYGFFRLILDGAGPHSVGRGGTRLEEPIRKALQGFRTETDVSRVLVLITDGEDHDSHPLDAARGAAERGVKILSIGFGDESGSTLFVSDPVTGARTQIRDASGQPVVTRLDGQTLREIALTTDGAYIPAGTGALDLKAIYDAHIAPLVRGTGDVRGRAQRKDAFQWLILASFFALLVSILAGSGSAREPRASASSIPLLAKVAALALTLALLPLPVEAQPLESRAGGASPAGERRGGNSVTDSQTAPDSARPWQDSVEPGTLPPASPSSSEDPSDPRELYNLALTYLTADLDRAERMLITARQRAGTDGDVRFRASYNLGMLDASRAEQRLQDNPQDALQRLQRAADWFRDAARLRPDHGDSRHNLEVVLRRALELADSLARKDQRDLAQRLDALIDSQRVLVNALRPVVDQFGADPDSDDTESADRWRTEFRQLALQQRKLLAEGQTVAQAARDERTNLSGKQSDDRTPNEQLRIAQLDRLLEFASTAEQRLGQAHSQLRRRQAARAFRRAASGLVDWKRARDQLRSPLEILDVLLADGSSLVELTRQRANDAEQKAPPPAWLDAEYLHDEGSSFQERLQEFVALLRDAVPGNASAVSGPPTAEQSVKEQQEQQFAERVREALPLLEQAGADMQSALRQLADDHCSQALDHEMRALIGLRNARELFLDLRGVIELAFARQQLVEQVLRSILPREVDADDADSTGDDRSHAESSVQQRDKLLDGIMEIQGENQSRTARLARMVDDEMRKSSASNPIDDGATVSAAQPGGQVSSGAQPPNDAAIELQRLEMARELTASARQEIQFALEALRRSSTSPGDQTSADAAEKLPVEPAPSDLPPVDASRSEGPATALPHVSNASQSLRELRRLFFSVIEHLRETAQRQSELNDDTERAIVARGLDKSSTPESQDSPRDDLRRFGPLVHRQQELQSIAAQIADLLDEQATQTTSQPATAPQASASAHGGKEADPQADAAESARKLQEAAALVREATEAMSAARQTLDVQSDNEDTDRDPAKFQQGRTEQDLALEKLIEALRRLQPPQSQDPKQDQQSDQDQQQEQQQQDQKQDQQDASSPASDPARLLQKIRDREAQRRKDREKRQRGGQDPVDKDW